MIKIESYEPKVSVIEQYLQQYEQVQIDLRLKIVPEKKKEMSRHTDVIN